MEFFLRDPEPEPIRRFSESIPQDESLKVTFFSVPEGNRILDVTVVKSGASPVPFDVIMADFQTKRLVVGIVASVFFTVGNIMLVAIWIDHRSTTRGA